MKVMRSKTKIKTGFTMIEVLAVITIIAILAAISVSVVGSVLSTAKVASTRATIEHLHEVLHKRMDGFTRHLIDMDKKSDPPSYVNLSDVTLLGKRGAIAKGRKFDFKKHFPQYLDPRTGTTATTAANAAEIFYDFIVNGETFGTDTEDTDQGPLRSSIGDTDGDGRMEFVDGWGHPLRFYRWPTALVRDIPLTGMIRPDLTVAKTLITSRLPKLDSDKDDPLGFLDKRLSPAEKLQFRIDFHQLNTYSVPLIVSAGVDGELGLYEPFDFANFGHLANWDPAKLEDIYDNITNHNQKAGSN